MTAFPIPKSMANSRWLCCKGMGLPLDWQSTLARLAQYIENSPQINLMGGRGRAQVIFASSPRETVGLSSVESVLGLEILGHESLPPEAGHQLLDMNHGQCYGLAEPFALKDLTRPELLSTATKMLLQLRTEGILLASGWRILWDRDDSEKHIDIQFFSEL